MKKNLTKQEEFDIMKLVLDKFLWLGIAIMGYGFFRLVTVADDFVFSFLIMIAGVIVLVIFMIILVKEYEFIKR